MANEEQQATLRETIQSSIEQHSEPETPVVAPVEQVAAEKPAEPVESKPGRTAGRARDEQGKLLPGKAEVAEIPKPVAAAPVAEQAPTVPAVETPVVPPIQRPSSWSKEMWPLWDKLNTGAPLTAQEARQIAEYNAKRETQFATGVSTYKQIADTAKPLMDAIAPFKADMDQHGIQAPEMVHRLMSAHKNLSLGSPQQKLSMFNQLAQQYGIPIQALYDQNAQNQFLATPHIPQQQPAPAQTDIASQVEQILAAREVQQTVTSMAADTQKYPFFNYVRSDMAQLLETGEATDLSDAYQKCLELPQHAMLTSVLQQQQEQAVAKQQEQDRAATVQATARVARANAVSPKSATPAAAGQPTGKQGVRDALREAVAIHAGGARV